MNRLKRILPREILHTLYCSVVQSHLNFGILAWGFKYSRLQKIQKKIIRTINCAKYNSHTEPLFKQMGVLKIEDIFTVNLLKFYFKYMNNELPCYFKYFQILNYIPSHGYGTRSGSQIRKYFTSTKSAENCIRFHIIEIINKTNPNILTKVHTHSYSGFINYSKKCFISSYNDKCNIVNCYICHMSVS